MDSSSKYTGKRPMAVDDDVIITTTDQIPRRTTHHRRAHSDTAFRLDDLLLFDPSDLDLSSLDLLPPPPAATAAANPPSFAADSPPFSDDSTSNGGGGGGGGGSGFPPKPLFGHHLRSLSVDSDFFDSLGLTGAVVSGGGDDKLGAASGEVKIGGGEKRGKHRHSLSMDGSINAMSIFETEDSSVKKAMASDKLAELALIDPKRAKRSSL